MRAVLRLNRTPLSPLVVFPAAWIFAALLSQYHLLNGQYEWSTIMVVVVAAVPLAFIGGALIGEGLALRRERASTVANGLRASRAYRRILIVLLAIGLLELAHQFAKIGGIPLLSSGGGVLRFSQGGPTIILIDGLTVAAIVALVRPRNVLARESRFELAVALTALGGFALQAGRGSVVLPVIVAIAARWLYWGRPRNWMFVAGGLLAFAAVVFGFYLRTRQNPYNPFESELFGELLPGIPFFLQPLVPIYLAITTNFYALQGVVGHFPTGEAFGNGAFNAIGLDIIFSGARNVSDVSAPITAPWVTSTVAGPLWADGGFLALIPGIAFTGFVSAGAYAMAVKTRAFRWSLVAAYLLYLAVFGLYTNLWTQSLDWLLVVPLLLIVGAIAEDPAKPPGLTGWAWGRIRRMMGRIPTPNAPAAPPEAKPKNRVSWGLILTGIGIVALLFASGAVIQRILPKPYPLLTSQRLPQAVAGAAAVMTNSDRPSDNEPLLWVGGRDRLVNLNGYVPGRPLAESERVARIPIPSPISHTSFDVHYWPPWRAQALYSFEQRTSNLAITINPTWKSDGRPVSFVAPLSEPPAEIAREFMVGAWGGDKPDLFVISRGDPEGRPTLQILSGESGFRRQLYATRLPYRGLAPEEWSMQIAPIVGLPTKHGERIFKGIRLDLVMIRHDPDDEHSMVQVLLGETGFQWNAVRRVLDNSGAVPPGTEFLIGSRQGGTAIYEVLRGGASGPRLRVFALTNPPAIQ
jgi:oligosaccharide repeat unit polymerase